MVYFPGVRDPFRVLKPARWPAPQGHVSPGTAAMATVAATGCRLAGGCLRNPDKASKGWRELHGAMIAGVTHAALPELREAI